MQSIYLLQADAVAGLFAGLGILWLIGLVLSVFWIWMLVDCAMNPRLQDTEKIVWVLIILFTHVIGAAIYALVARSRSSS